MAPGCPRPGQVGSKPVEALLGLSTTVPTQVTLPRPQGRKPGWWVWVCLDWVGGTGLLWLSEGVTVTGALWSQKGGGGVQSPRYLLAFPPQGLKFPVWGTDQEVTYSFSWLRWAALA